MDQPDDTASQAQPVSVMEILLKLVPAYHVPEYDSSFRGIVVDIVDIAERVDGCEHCILRDGDTPIVNLFRAKGGAWIQVDGYDLRKEKLRRLKCGIPANVFLAAITNHYDRP